MMPARLAALLAIAVAASACAPAGQPGVGATSQAGATPARGVIPRYERVLALESTAETSANVGIGDVNGDGHLDIVLAKGRHWPLVDRVLLGDGRGSFPRAYDLGPTADRSYSGRVVDIDADGDLDVVISNDTPDPKLVHINDGTGRFRVGSAAGRATWPTRNAAVADVNGDDMPDIILANRTGGDAGANYICLNRGGGRFDDDCVAFAPESATTITPADFNGDGRIDLAVPHRDGGQSYVYIQDAAGFPNFRKVPFGAADAAIRVAEAADLDGDGLLDIVAIDERRGVASYFGQRTGTFSPAVPVGQRTAVPYALAVGDLNLDGVADIIVGHVQAPSRAYINDGSGRRFTPVEFGDNQGTAYGFAIGDLDRDGLPDIAVARSEATNVVYFATSARR